MRRILIKILKLALVITTIVLLFLLVDNIEKNNKQFDFQNKQIKTLSSQQKDTKEQIDALLNQQEVTKEQIETLDSIITLQEIDLEDKIKKPSYDYLRSVTVYIYGKKIEPEDFAEIRAWRGTGIIIKITEDFTYILTNAHIAGRGKGKGDTNIKILNGVVERKATVMGFYKYADLAIIRVAGKLEDKQAIKGYSTARPQDRIFVVGQHLSRPYIYGEGVFAGYDGSVDLVQLPVAYGNSGSGVFNKDGKLVGLLFAINYVNFFSLDTAHGLAVNINDIKCFLSDYGLLEE